MKNTQTYLVEFHRENIYNAHMGKSVAEVYLIEK